MKIIARFKGMLGEIAIWENEADGHRLYLEGDIFQSHGSQAGETQLDYVKIAASRRDQLDRSLPKLKRIYNINKHIDNLYRDVLNIIYGMKHRNCC